MFTRLMGPTAAFNYSPDDAWKKLENKIGEKAKILWFAGIATADTLWRNIYLFEQEDGSYKAIQPIFIPKRMLPSIKSNEDNNNEDVQIEEHPEQLIINEWEASPRGTFIEGDNPEITYVPAIIRISPDGKRISTHNGNLPKGSFGMQYDIKIKNNTCVIKLSERCASIFNPKAEANAASIIVQDKAYVMAGIQRFAQLTENETSKLCILQKLKKDKTIIWSVAMLSSDLGIFGVTQNIIPRWLIGTPNTIQFNEKMTHCQELYQNKLPKYFDVVQEKDTYTFQENKNSPFIETKDKNAFEKAKKWLTQKN